ncbi:MAG TPA: nitroreductase family protein [Acidimicrobiales bacterium]|nr:nitroreductase family protein [Acidimicrobiales bacterium]
MDFHDVARRRRMIRSFDDTPVSTEVVDHLIDVARRSPSAGYSQGVDFVVLQGPDETNQFWDVPGVRDFWEPRFPGLLRAPVLVFPFADSGRYLRRYAEPDKAAAGLQDASAWPVPYWLVDTAMATMALLLAVVDAGLGALFFGLRAYGPLLERLAVPPDREPIGVVAIGHPADASRTGSSVTRPRRPLSEVLHRGHW